VSLEFPSFPYGIVGGRFSSAGIRVASEFQVNTHSIHYWAYPYPAVAADADGEFVVVWNSLSVGDYDFAVLGKRFSSTASPLTGVFQVNAHTSSAGSSPWVVAEPGGDFIVAWDAFDGSETGVLARRFSSTGYPLAVEFQVNTHTQDGQGIFRSMAANAAGQFIVTWNSSDQDGSDVGMFGQRFALPTATSTLTASATPTITLTPTSSATSLPAADLYAIPTLSRVALAILVVLLSAIAIVFLLAKPSGAR
jgi:hypothetical protein